MIRSELLIFAVSLCFGAGIIVSYGIAELLRLFLGVGKVLRVLSELIYWTVAAILAFLLQFHLNNGVLRLYSVVGAAVGLLVFHLFTGKLFSWLGERAKKSVRKRRLRNKKRRLAVQNRLKKIRNQVKIKISLLRKPHEAEEGEL